MEYMLTDVRQIGLGFLSVTGAVRSAICHCALHTCNRDVAAGLVPIGTNEGGTQVLDRWHYRLVTYV